MSQKMIVGIHVLKFRTSKKRPIRLFRTFVLVSKDDSRQTCSRIWNIKNGPIRLFRTFVLVSNDNSRHVY